MERQSPLRNASIWFLAFAACLPAALPAQAAGQSLVITPAVSPADSAVHIVASGLHPGSTATIVATARDASGQRWRSSATCVADAAGSIDLDRCAPTAGTYHVADGMGLFWSMRQQDGEPDFFTFPETPRVRYEFELLVGDSVVYRTAAERQQYPSTIVRVPLDTPVVGAAFEWDDGVRRPAVILIGGSGSGHPMDTEAALLASHGYETLSLAYFNVKGSGLPDRLVRIPIETVEHAIGWLKARATVDTTRIAVIGHSRGSELALLSAATFPSINAVIVLAGSPVGWPGIDPRDFAHDVPAWTYRDAALPFLPAASGFGKAFRDHAPMITGFNLALDDTAAVRAAEIPIERIRGPILFLVGEADALWPSDRFARLGLERLREQHHSFHDQLEEYPDAGHWFFEPYIPLERRLTWRVSWRTLDFGGTVEGDAHATERAYARMLRFLGEAFGQTR